MRFMINKEQHDLISQKVKKYCNKFLLKMSILASIPNDWLLGFTQFSYEELQTLIKNLGYLKTKHQVDYRADIITPDIKYELLGKFIDDNGCSFYAFHYFLTHLKCFYCIYMECGQNLTVLPVIHQITESDIILIEKSVNNIKYIDHSQLLSSMRPLNDLNYLDDIFKALQSQRKASKEIFHHGILEMMARKAIKYAKSHDGKIDDVFIKQLLQKVDDSRIQITKTMALPLNTNKPQITIDQKQPESIKEQNLEQKREKLHIRDIGQLDLGTMQKELNLAQNFEINKKTIDKSDDDIPKNPIILKPVANLSSKKTINDQHINVNSFFNGFDDYKEVESIILPIQRKDSNNISKDKLEEAYQIIQTKAWEGKTENAITNNEIKALMTENLRNIPEEQLNRNSATQSIIGKEDNPHNDIKILDTYHPHERVDSVIRDRTFDLNTKRYQLQKPNLNLSDLDEVYYTCSEITANNIKITTDNTENNDLFGSPYFGKQHRIQLTETSHEKDLKEIQQDSRPGLKQEKQLITSKKSQLRSHIRNSKLDEAISFDIKEYETERDNTLTSDQHIIKTLTSRLQAGIDKLTEWLPILSLNKDPAHRLERDYGDKRCDSNITCNDSDDQSRKCEELDSKANKMTFTHNIIFNRNQDGGPSPVKSGVRVGTYSPMKLKKIDDIPPTF